MFKTDRTFAAKCIHLVTNALHTFRLLAEDVKDPSERTGACLVTRKKHHAQLVDQFFAGKSLIALIARKHESRGNIIIIFTRFTAMRIKQFANRFADHAAGFKHMGLLRRFRKCLFNHKTKNFNLRNAFFKKREGFKYLMSYALGNTGREYRAANDICG